MKIKNESVGPRGFMKDGKIVWVAPGAEGECPADTKLPEGLVEVAEAPKPKPAPKKVKKAESKSEDS